MASWNGSFPEDENIHNYNYVTPAYADNNVQSYPANWAYYPVSTVPDHQSTVDGLQQLHTPTFTNQPVQTNFNIAAPPQFVNLSQRLQGVNECDRYLNSNDTNFASPPVTASSLTATAGEFIPRHAPMQSSFSNNGGGDRRFQTGYMNVSSAATSDQNHTVKRNGKNESKYFYTNRNQSSGPKPEMPFNKRKSNSRGNADAMSNMEKMKNDDRQRLLLEAAAFLTPTPTLNNTESKVPSAPESSSKPEKKRPESHGNRVITNSYKWNENAPGNYRTQANQQKKRGGSSYQSSGFQHQRNPPEYTADGNSNGRKTHYQNRFNNFHNSGSSYHRPAAIQQSSPKKNSYGDQHTRVSADDDSSQRERLADQLERGTLECLVCCERVRQHDPVWNCSNCYHVLHLKCIKKWAKSSRGETGWRCPACQNVTAQVPHDYYCFCGKARDPEWNRMDAAHSCGQMCGRTRSDKHPECTHRCTLLCHPGPCPTCVAQVNRSCGCGKKSQAVKCGSDQPLLCGAECGKQLNCTLHYCKEMCHVGRCTECQEKITQVCYCEKTTKEVACTAESLNQKNFSCEGTCDKMLSCGNHKCALKCHLGPCPACELTPDKVTHCPCGQTPLAEQRSSCLDPVSTCGLQCNKKLPCGPSNDPHTCQLLCHIGPCPVCPLSTNVKCRCGNMYREILCQDLPTKGSDARCEKKCTKKRSCGKHKCNQFCCIDQDHICPLPCNHQLSCGQHRCEDTCHRGRCPPCWRMSFEELFCECGSSVSYPPIPCGTRRPECSKPCSRPHPCEHPALHNCHSQPNCPPCTVLTQKYCYGKHELRKSIPCHQNEFSCGLPCNVALPCGRHHCILPCHKGPCLKEGQSCSQPCTTPRNLCGHNCAAPCHDGPCPDTPCKETVKVTCECGHRSMSRACHDNAKEYQRIATSLLASKMADMQLGHSVDIGDILSNPSTRKVSLKTLECNDECKVIERNRRLAIGLQIRNPDLSAKLTPRYSEFMRQWAKKDPHFCNMVHEKLTELVQLAKQSKQKSRSYSFDSMNRDKRHFVHEYCEHFGCESVAYDQEPKRNVVATAARDKAWLPSMSLLEVIQRESGQRKIPKPVITSSRAPSQRTMDVLPVKCSPIQSTPVTEKSAGSVTSAKPCPEEDEIDYFDFT
ncbi:Protein shuttle craft [Blattella germanica]|nr:Protein shuttle craft [Blattella germanica]